MLVDSTAVIYPAGNGNFRSLVEKEDFRIDSEVRCGGAHLLYDAVSWQGLNPIKLAYDPRRPVSLTHQRLAPSTD